MEDIIEQPNHRRLAEIEFAHAALRAWPQLSGETKSQIMQSVRSFATEDQKDPDTVALDFELGLQEASARPDDETLDVHRAALADAVRPVWHRITPNDQSLIFGKARDIAAERGERPEEAVAVIMAALDGPRRKDFMDVVREKAAEKERKRREKRERQEAARDVLRRKGAHSTPSRRSTVPGLGAS